MTHAFYLKEQLTNTVVIQIWAFGRCPLKNELSEPVTLRKAVFVTNEKVQVRWKSEVWKTCSAILNLTSSHYMSWKRIAVILVNWNF